MRAVAARLDETSAPKALKMRRHKADAHLRRIGKLLNAALALSEHVDELQSARRGQTSSDTGELLVQGGLDLAILSHSAILTIVRLAPRR